MLRGIVPDCLIKNAGLRKVLEGAKALTIQIEIFGRINVGKSSLMNFITTQNTSIVS